MDIASSLLLVTCAGVSSEDEEEVIWLGVMFDLFYFEQ